MVIAESSVGRQAALAFAQGCAGACELFEDVDAPRYLALVPNGASDQAGWTFTSVDALFSGGRCGPTAGEWLFCVGLSVPAEHRDDFLAWYEQDHLPILLECPDWDGCRFAEAPVANGCQFFALHQLANEAALRSAERTRSRATPWFYRLKQFVWFDEPFTRTLYRRVDRNES